MIVWSRLAPTETIWISVPVSEPTAPEGVVNVGGEWFYDEYAKGGGVTSLGNEDKANTQASEAAQTLPAADEKKRILDLFKN